MRLLEWNGPVVDPGSSTTQTIMDYNQTHVFRAVFDEPVPFDFIWRQRECPTYYDPLVFNGQTNRNLFVVGRSAKQLPDAPQSYDVSIEYANRMTNEQNKDQPNTPFTIITDPTLRPAMYTGSNYTVREALPFTYPDLGNDDEYTIPVVTTAGEPLILEQEFHHRRFTITKNVRELSELMIRGGDYINRDRVRLSRSVVYPAESLWLWPIEFGHLSFENGVYFFPITMTILHNPRGWRRRLRNAGYYMRSFNSKFRQTAQAPVPGQTGQSNTWTGLTEYFPMEPIRFRDDSRPDRPVLLNKGGRPLQAIITGESPDPDNVNSSGLQAIPNPIPQGYTLAYFLANVRKIKHYDILSPEQFARAFTQQELKETELKFRTLKLLNFATELPLQ